MSMEGEKEKRGKLLVGNWNCWKEWNSKMFCLDQKNKKIEVGSPIQVHVSNYLLSNSTVNTLCILPNRASEIVVKVKDQQQYLRKHNTTVNSLGGVPTT